MINADFTDAQMVSIEKVRKLLALAEGNANEHEAAAAMERANFILSQMNLDMDAVKKAGGKDSSARADNKTVGGFYQHERDMYAAIAKLNYCFYWTVKVIYDAEKAKKEKRKYAHHHRVIGRSVNILATQMMADYLLTTLERLTKEYCLEERPYEKFHPRSSTAVSFRKGAAHRLIEKINSRRRAILREEQEKEAAARAAGTSSTPGSALVVTGLIKSEHEANYDFIHGEGAYQRAMDSNAEWERRMAKAEEERQAKHLWDMDNDPDYRKAYEKAQRDEERRANRRTGRQYHEPQFKGDASAFNAGYRIADNVSLDHQVKQTKQDRLS